MKFITGKRKGCCFVGLIDGNHVIDMQRTSKEIPTTLVECIEMGDKFIEISEKIWRDFSKGEIAGEYIYSLSEVELLAPIPQPRKNVFCVGKNYREHVLEMGSADEVPEDMIVFTKAPTTVIGTNTVVDSHQQITSALDYEGELAVVIGKSGKEIKEEEAFDYIFGYTIINDITARDMQKKHKQYFLGKSLDTSCPMGPSIVHKSAILNPQNIKIETKVNGEVRQQSNTSMMMFSIPQIISIISKGMTLEPGDIIATGTPAGVGNGFQPPRYLQSGDVMEVTIEGIGTLVNTVD